MAKNQETSAVYNVIQLDMGQWNETIKTLNKEDVDFL